MASSIEDYAVIGDCHTAALVARNGSIDWLCFPRFDSGACFAALLGDDDNGSWSLAPVAPIRSVSRRYRDATMILETEYTTDEGTVLLTDFMPPRVGPPRVVRIVTGKQGCVRMQGRLTIRFDYGSVVPWVRKLELGGGICATGGPDTLYLQTSVPLHGEDLHTVCDFSLNAGEEASFELVWTRTHDPSPGWSNSGTLLQACEQWWSSWSAHCDYDGQWKDAVLRSLLTLKAMTYAPTGGIVAAITTSLPEEIGGGRNWDYRFCWLRDAAFTLYALTIGGYREEAQAWRTWLINAVAGSPSQLQIMYGLAGERRLTELLLPWLKGYEGSSPVRVGNAAWHQRQLDVYGEVMAAFHFSRRANLPPDEQAWRIQKSLVHFLEQVWQEPDEGIWEVRGRQQHFTHSKVMAWLAIDRAVKAVEEFGLAGELQKWRELRDRIHAEVCEKGFNPRVNSFVQYYGSAEPDASLLLLPVSGFLPAHDWRIRGTVDYIQRTLVRDGFVARYRTETGVDGMSGGEGAFLMCTFWLADNLALMGRVAEATEIFERLLALRNDVGLLSEEYDVGRKRFCGNFPQAFSHVGLIYTARTLSRCHSLAPAAAVR